MECSGFSSAARGTRYRKGDEFAGGDRRFGFAFQEVHQTSEELQLCMRRAAPPSAVFASFELDREGRARARRRGNCGSCFAGAFVLGFVVYSRLGESAQDSFALPDSRILAF